MVANFDTSGAPTSRPTSPLLKQGHAYYHILVMRATLEIFRSQIYAVFVSSVRENEVMAKALAQLTLARFSIDGHRNPLFHPLRLTTKCGCVFETFHL